MADGTFRVSIYTGVCPSMHWPEQWYLARTKDRYCIESYRLEEDIRLQAGKDYIREIIGLYANLGPFYSFLYVKGFYSRIPAVWLEFQRYINLNCNNRLSFTCPYLVTVKYSSRLILRDVLNTARIVT